MSVCLDLPGVFFSFGRVTKNSQNQSNQNIVSDFYRSIYHGHGNTMGWFLIKDCAPIKHTPFCSFYRENFGYLDVNKSQSQLTLYEKPSYRITMALNGLRKYIEPIEFCRKDLVNWIFGFHHGC